jgi:catalase (peroxidase I)
MGLIYLNPQGPSGNLDPIAAARDMNLDRFDLA